ncbi:MAG: hypothetical protein IPG11_03880 [Flavobacteriales bacterium]|nr:hypothetical protein [Flavobacteriales bacterium]
MRTLDTEHRITPTIALLLAAVSGVPLVAIQRATIVPSATHWLRLPWYRRAGGGAMVLGERIHVSTAALTDERDPSRLLFLLAHEVGHLPHAARFGKDRIGRLHFFLWAAGHYARSSLRYGAEGYRLSRIEQEADHGRWVLRELLRRTGTSPETLPTDPMMMSAWIEDHAHELAELHSAYPKRITAERST